MPQGTIKDTKKGNFIVLIAFKLCNQSIKSKKKVSFFGNKFLVWYPYPETPVNMTLFFNYNSN